MRLRIPARPRATTALISASLALALAACDGGSGGGDDAPDTVSSRAVDGYIVGASVFCDDVPSGGTAAGGLLVCPAGTVLASVRGGSDVGFDVTATSGGLPFVGELVAPLSFGWVTPLSTLAVAMADDGEGYEGARLAGVIDALAVTFGQSTLDLSVDPTRTPQLYRLNAQIHQLVSAFAATEDGYRETTAALAEFVRRAAANGRSYSLGSASAEVVGLLNAELLERGSPLALGPDELGVRIARVQEVNGAIEIAERADLVFGAALAAPLAGQALTIERDAAVVAYAGGSVSSEVSLEDFESDDVVGSTFAPFAGGSVADARIDSYRTVVDGSGTLYLYDDAFTVDRTLLDERVSLGFELVAVGDDGRAIAVTTSEARVSARRGDSDSVTITLPAGSALRVRSVSDAGTVTTATIVLKRDHDFLAENGGIDLSFWRIDRELERRGFGDLTARAGNYRMTVAIGGVRINERDGTEVRRATVRSVDSGDEVVSGSGFRGYVTIAPSDLWYY